MRGNKLLLKIKCRLSPGWLKIDPNFDPLRKIPPPLGGAKVGAIWRLQEAKADDSNA